MCALGALIDETFRSVEKRAYCIHARNFNKKTNLLQDLFNEEQKDAS